MPRLITVPIAAELVASSLSAWEKHRTLRVTSGLPDGAVLRTAEVRWVNGGWELLLGFECPGDGRGPEQINPMFSEYYGRDPERAAGLIPDEPR